VIGLANSPPPIAEVAGRRRGTMNLDSWIAAILAVALLVYLVYTLLRPEKF
jgi:K+-transporting ATPase KdpF subunit